MLRHLFLAALLSFPVLADWSAQRTNAGIDVTRDGKPVARFVFGDAELKPFLHLFGPDGEFLTEWSANQQFPHHRGIFIGWNRIRSDLDTDDLWHLRRQEKMLARDVQISTMATGAVIRAKIEWRASRNSNALLLEEERTLHISQPVPGKTQVDARFVLTAARDLTLDGDLQHAGVHFRASTHVTAREKETRYVWEPDLPGPGGKVSDPGLKWCRFIFPLEDQWFSATQINAPSNPVEELSWRAYGRFGFFFKKRLARGESLPIQYRFVVEKTVPPENLASEREGAQAEYDRFVRETRYEFRAQHDPNGLGRFYMGREIAHFMTHEGADWLERPEREREEQPEKMVELLGLKPGDHVADIGAGTGYITRRIAGKVGPAGKVYAVEIQQEMLDILMAKVKERGISNVVPVLGEVANPKLPPASIDLAIMVDVYHELEQPAEMLENIIAALKPGGRIAFVEFRAEDPRVPIKAVHKMTEAQIRKEAAAAGLQWEKTFNDLPWQHLVLMRKPAERP